MQAAKETKSSTITIALAAPGAEESAAQKPLASCLSCSWCCAVCGPVTDVTMAACRPTRPLCNQGELLSYIIIRVIACFVSMAWCSINIRMLDIYPQDPCQRDVDHSMRVQQSKLWCACCWGGCQTHAKPDSCIVCVLCYQPHEIFARLISVAKASFLYKWCSTPCTLVVLIISVVLCKITALTFQHPQALRVGKRVMQFQPILDHTFSPFSHSR